MSAATLREQVATERVTFELTARLLPCSGEASTQLVELTRDLA